jgi:PLP dependent protein
MPKNLSKRVALIEEQIAKAAKDCGRNIADIKLVAVTKGRPFEDIESCFELGVRDFGESYAQEFDQKVKLAQQKVLQDIKWHFIGNIQSNKIKIICQAYIIHSVASIRHAELINTNTVEIKKIFCQINLNPKNQRQGFSIDEIIPAFKAIKQLKNIEILGLMTILPTEPKKPPEFWFKQMHKLKRQILDLGLSKDIKLSMGMSGDFLGAICHDANILRIGSAIFGT